MNSSTKKLMCILLMGVISFVILALYGRQYLGRERAEGTRWVDELYQHTCSNVLDKMVVGHWVRNNASLEEVMEVENFHNKIRKYLGLPLSLQRKDGRCGNLHLDGEVKPNSGIQWFRALCNPDGNSPCCYEYQCVSKPVDQCKCEQCYDVRQHIHAELSTWVPTDPTCKITKFVGEQVTCKVLTNVTIYFIGDSFMRQLYMGVINSFGAYKPYGPLNESAPSDILQLCDRLYRVARECTPFTLTEASECGNTTQLRWIPFYHSSATSNTLKLIRQLQFKPSSFVIFGAGVHENFNLNIVENVILKPILYQLSKSTWPILVWLSTHATGLLKAPKYIEQQTGTVVRYNLRINDFLRKRRIPVLDFYQMTTNVMSYDGTHYGPGINDLKAQILLNYISEVNSNMTNA